MDNVKIAKELVKLAKELQGDFASRSDCFKNNTIYIDQDGSVVVQLPVSHPYTHKEIKTGYTWDMSYDIHRSDKESKAKIQKVIDDMREDTSQMFFDFSENLKKMLTAKAKIIQKLVDQVEIVEED